MTTRSPSPAPYEQAIQQVIAYFNAYDRARGALDSVLAASRASPREEQRAFNDLRQAVERLRHTTQ
ncbi:hypothetical protein HEK131_45150 [Streptomyces seoulensis]|nr:hypothetical protein HEK131_45150 [Streptomyces seoulensis]